jgi:hypothetical protein
MDSREYPLDTTRCLKPVHALEQTSKESAVIRQHGVVAVLKELRLGE